VLAAWAIYRLFEDPADTRGAKTYAIGERQAAHMRDVRRRNAERLADVAWEARGVHY